MILWKSGGRYYEMVTGAFLCDLDGLKLLHVRNKAEVLAYVRAHPDRPFELTGGLRLSGYKLKDAPDLTGAVVCGPLRFDSRMGELENTPFDAP
jgi:hypothetical protein